jgi:hypothetical protein
VSKERFISQLENHIHMPQPFVKQSSTDTWERTSQKVEKLAKERKWFVSIEANLDDSIRPLARQYKNKTPVDLFGHPRMGKIYLTGIQEAKNIKDLYAKIQGRVIALLRYDFRKIKKIPYEITRPIMDIGGMEYMLTKLTTLIKEIAEEFKEVLLYYEYIIKNERLPKWSVWSKKLRILSKYNYRSITDPLENISHADMRLLGIIDRAIRTVKEKR